MPRASHTYRFSAILFAGLCVLCAQGTRAQGFDKVGMLKKKVVLRRKLPSVIHFTGTTFQVKVTSRDPKFTDVAVILKDRLETEISKSNPHLQSSEKSAELVVNCRITSLDLPPAESVKNVETVWVKGPANAKGKQQNTTAQMPVEYTRVKGSLEISYGAEDRGQHRLDSKNVSAKYSEDFNSATKVAASKSGIDKMEIPSSACLGKKRTNPAGRPLPRSCETMRGTI